jgi:hypothetical protein
MEAPALPVTRPSRSSATRRFPVGASPTRQPLQPEATGAVMEVTKWLKPSISVSQTASRFKEIGPMAMGPNTIHSDLRGKQMG